MGGMERERLSYGLLGVSLREQLSGHHVVDIHHIVTVPTHP